MRSTVFPVLGVVVLLAAGACSGNDNEEAGGGGAAGAAAGGTGGQDPTCPVGQIRCAGECVSLETSILNCGTCGQACASAQSCVSGVCTCPGTFESCGDACVDTDTNLQHCGGCDNVCGDRELCIDGACTCEAGRDECDGACVDLQADPANCGTCGTICDATEVCNAGTCTTEGCGSLTNCSQACVDLDTEAAHCGACDNSCPPGGQCTSGSCGCSADYIECDGLCIDPQTELAHCGACGTECTAGQTCTLGVCASTGTGTIADAVADAQTIYLDNFDNDGLGTNTGIGGGAVSSTIDADAWADDGNGSFVANGATDTQRALLYSESAFQSDTGFRLTVRYTTGSTGDVGAHNLSFGLISSDTDLSTYSGYNPFLADANLYSIGANVTADGGAAARGLNFTDGSTRTTLDESGTRAQFGAGEPTEVTIEIGIGGYWYYSINGVYEASGVLLEGFDLTKDYHVVVYGQDGDGGGKSIHSIQLKTAYAAGERAAGMRAEWNGGQGDLEAVKEFKTLDSIGMNFTDGATLSAQHYAPHKLLETIALEGVDGTGPAIEFVVAPSWGDLGRDEPENDAFLARILEIKAAGFKVEGYTNCENFVGPNGDALQEFVDRWLDYCDTNPEIQAFIDSQPFHTGVWNRTTQQYEDASGTYPMRKYVFVYAEYVLKDYALRYGEHLGSWIFDDGATMEENGDNATSGLIEEQRLYQAFANAVHAGNPEVPIAFNNGRSTVNYDSFPFAHAVRFEDFTFGHAFGGNNDHADKTGTQFDNNYLHITRMTETDGYVHDGGSWEWDDLIVGNFHSKLSTTAWKYGTVQAWEEADFFQWNLEAMHAGGHMAWDGSIWRSDPTLQDWAYDLLKGLDDHLAEFQSPGAPNWARAYTVLPQAITGQDYHHVLEVGIDLWDPEGDQITAVSAVNGAPAWLDISEDPLNPGSWILSGVPTETAAMELSFSLQATDDNGLRGEREVRMDVAVQP